MVSCVISARPMANINRMILVIFATTILSSSASAAPSCPSTDTSCLLPPPNASCACPEDVLHYTCIVTITAGRIVWSGSALDCNSASNEIVHRISQFNNTTPISCGNATATPFYYDGSSLYAVNLSISVGMNSNITCKRNSEVVGSSSINIVSSPLSAPSDVTLVQINDGQLLFKWSEVGCPSTTYSIISDNCGICPEMTTAPNVTCYGLNLTMNANCTLSVRSRICNYESHESSNISLVLKVPLPPVKNDMMCEVSGDQISLSINNPQDNISITNNVSAPITFYKFVGYTSSFETVYEEVQPVSSTCMYFLNKSSAINVTGINNLGEGTQSEPIQIRTDCTLSGRTSSRVIEIAVSLAVAIAILCAIIIVCVFVWIYRKRCRRKKEETDNIEIIISKYFRSEVRGYHYYERHWKPEVGDTVCTKREPKNKSDEYSVAVVESTKSKKVIGHIPRQFARDSSEFIKEKGTIWCRIIEDPKIPEQDPINSKGMTRKVVPCVYKYCTTDRSLLERTVQNIKRYVSENIFSEVPNNNW